MAFSEERIDLSTEPPITPLHVENDSELSSRGVPEEALTHRYDPRVPLEERPNPDNIGNQMNRSPLVGIGGFRGFIKQNRSVILAVGASLIVLGVVWATQSRPKAYSRYRMTFSGLLNRCSHRQSFWQRLMPW